MQTFPCGHRVVCRKCFVKTIQVAVSQRLLPLRCVVCRAKVLRLRQSRDGPFPSSVSQYSMSANSNVAQHHVIPGSHSLYSFTSGSSGFSGVSNVSSASSESGESLRGSAIRPAKVYRQGARPQVIKKVRVTSRSGARTKEPLKGELPQIRIEHYDVIPVRLSSPAARSPRMVLRENKVAPQDINNRLPTIAEYAEYISSDRGDMEKEKSSSTRIRCAQKLVNQLESSNNNSTDNNSNNSSNNNIIEANLKVVYTKVINGTPSPTRKTVNPSSRSSTSIQSTSSKSPSKRPSPYSSNSKNPSVEKWLNNKNLSSGTGKSTKSGATSGKSLTISKSTSDGKITSKKTPAAGENSSSKTKTVRRDSSSSSASLKSSASISSNMSTSSIKSNSSNKSSSSTKSSSSFKSATSTISTKSSTSSFSTSSTLTVKSYRSLIPSLRKDTSCQKGSKEEASKKARSPKEESKVNGQKKRFEGKEYERLK